MLPHTAAKSLQLYPTLCDPIDSGPPGSPVPGTLQARTLEWVAISFFNAWKGKVKVKSLSRVRLFATPWSAAYQASPSMGFSRQEYWSGVPLPSPKCYLIDIVNLEVSLPHGHCQITIIRWRLIVFSKRIVGICFLWVKSSRIWNKIYVLCPGQLKFSKILLIKEIIKHFCRRFWNFFLFFPSILPLPIQLVLTIRSFN